jgi:type III secretory pathway component EscS
LILLPGAIIGWFCPNWRVTVLVACVYGLLIGLLHAALTAQELQEPFQVGYLIGAPLEVIADAALVRLIRLGVTRFRAPRD